MKKKMRDPAVRQRSRELWERKTALYRAFDPKGLLLYVGIAVNPATRLAGHAKSAHWYHYVARFEVEWHDSRREALDAEERAIMQENPLFNETLLGWRIALLLDDPIQFGARCPPDVAALPEEERREIMAKVKTIIKEFEYND